MAAVSPYRSLPIDRRITLLKHAISRDAASREGFIRRMMARGGGFRLETLRKWPAEQLAKEVARRGLEGPEDEVQLLITLYIELEPGIQTTFLEGAGVRHENGQIPEDLEAPYANIDAIRRGADALVSAFGEEGQRYLRCIATYNGAAWPGLAELITDRDW